MQNIFFCSLKRNSCSWPQFLFTL